MRTFGRKGWQVSEVGHGMWGMTGWVGGNDTSSMEALEKSLELGCNFYDSAWAYGYHSPETPGDFGRSDRLLGQLVKNHPGRQIYTASKVPPKNMQWPAPTGATLAETYERDHVIARAEEIRRNTGIETIDLLQFHTWDDNILTDNAWAEVVAELKEAKYCNAVGISLNTFDASNGIEAVRTGLIDSVQVVYNLFTRDAEDGLFDACREHKVAVIARVPFDEGSLTGQITRTTTFPLGEFRSAYFGHGNLEATMDRVDVLRDLIPASLTMSQVALAFVLSNPDIATVIPGMRGVEHVEENLSASEFELDSDLLMALNELRWDRHRDVPFA